MPARKNRILVDMCKKSKVVSDFVLYCINEKIVLNVCHIKISIDHIFK